MSFRIEAPCPDVRMRDLIRLAGGNVRLVLHAHDYASGANPGDRLAEIVRYIAKATCLACPDGTCENCRQCPDYPSRFEYHFGLRTRAAS